MPCTGSMKSADSTMLSCLSPRSPCCGPKAAVRRDVAERRQGVERVHQVTGHRGGMRQQRHAPPGERLAQLRAPRAGGRCRTSWVSRGAIEREREAVRVVKIGPAGRVAQRPVRQPTLGGPPRRAQSDAAAAAARQRRKTRERARVACSSSRRSRRGDAEPRRPRELGRRHARRGRREAIGRPVGPDGEKLSSK